MLLALEQRAVLALKHLLDRRALQHPVLEGGVVPELLDRHTVMLAPAVDDERVGVGGGILRAQHPLFAGSEGVELLQQCPGILAPGGLHVFARGFVGRKPAWAEDRKSTRLNSSHVRISYAV